MPANSQPNQQPAPPPVYRITRCQCGPGHYFEVHGFRGAQSWPVAICDTLAEARQLVADAERADRTAPRPPFAR